MSYKVIVKPEGKILDVDSSGEKSLLQVLQEAGYTIQSGCGGHASCSDCVVKILSGEDNLSPAPFEELRLLGNVFHITKERLSCQTKISGDISVDVTKHLEAAALMASGNAPTTKKKMTFKMKKKSEVKVIKKEQVEQKRQVSEEQRKAREEEREKKRETREKDWFQPWKKNPSQENQKEGTSPDQNKEEETSFYFRRKKKKRIGGGRRPKQPRAKTGDGENKPGREGESSSGNRSFQSRKTSRRPFKGRRTGNQGSGNNRRGGK